MKEVCKLCYGSGLIQNTFTEQYDKCPCKSEDIETIMIQPTWYKINGEWYHCVTDENGIRHVNGIKQEN